MHVRRIVAFGVALAALLPSAAPPARADSPALEVSVLDSSIRLSGAGAAWRVAYPSTSWDGRPTVTTGTITVPPGHPPAGGWPVASFAPGFGGTADACAPSLAGPAPWERVAQEALLGAGYAVVVTDYERISLVDGRAEAYAIIDIVRAARRLAAVSRTWVGVGYSLGGHGVLFAASIAPAYAPTLRHAGTIALAPVTQWGLQLASPFVRDPAAPASPTIPYSGRSLPLTTRGAFRPADHFTATGLDLVSLAGELCIGALATRMAGLTNADVFLSPAAAADAFAVLFAGEEIPIARYATPVRLMHGSADPLPAVLTEITAGQLAGAGNDVRYTEVPGADHFTLLPLVAADLVVRADELVRGWPSQVYRGAIQLRGVPYVALPGGRLRRAELRRLSRRRPQPGGGGGRASRVGGQACGAAAPMQWG